jgi:hypothetical protein
MTLIDKDKLFSKEINIMIQKLKDLKAQADLIQLYLKFKILSRNKHKLILNQIHNHQKCNIA